MATHGEGGTGTIITSREPPARPSSGGLVRVFADTEDHAHVQQRLGLLYGVLCLIIAFFFLFGLVGSLFVAPDSALAIHTSTPKILHALAIVGLAAGWKKCRGPLRSRLVLSVIDAGGLFETMLLVGLVIAFAPPSMRAETLAIGPFLLVVMLRAALVPSPPRWTACVTALASLPVPIAMAFAMHRGAVAPIAGMPAEAVPVMGAAWAIVGTFAAWLVSKVVYGLRVEVKNATRLGQYTLEEKIGEGGMGVVWRAKHALLRRPTAVKLLSPDRTDASSIRRFEREVQITSSLTHPNTVAIYDFGHTREGVFYYAMELLDGVTLQELVEEDGPQTPARVVHLLAQMASALAEAHDVGLVHRDVKPANVFLCERGGMPDFVKVLDFGLVKDQGHPDPGLSTANAIAGTPLYMAPESITNPDAIDGRVDLYALGCVGYWLLTARAPFEGANLVEICSHHLHTTPIAPSEVLGAPVPAALEELVLACLAKRPEGRPPSAHALAASLRAAQGACGTWGSEEAAAWWQARPERLSTSALAPRPSRNGFAAKAPFPGRDAEAALASAKPLAHLSESALVEPEKAPT